MGAIRALVSGTARRESTGRGRWGAQCGDFQLSLALSGAMTILQSLRPAVEVFHAKESYVLGAFGVEGRKEGAQLALSECGGTRGLHGQVKELEFSRSRNSQGKLTVKMSAHPQ